MSWDIFGFQSWGDTGICWVEASHAAKYPIMYRISPTRKNYLVRNINCVTFDKPCSGLNISVFFLLILPLSNFEDLYFTILNSWRHSGVTIFLKDVYQMFRYLSGFEAFMWSRTYFMKQWAAVTSQLLLIRVAPHRWTLFCWRLACQGHSPSLASTPSAILLPEEVIVRCPQPAQNRVH